MASFPFPVVDDTAATWKKKHKNDQTELQMEEGTGQQYRRVNPLQAYYAKLY